MNERDDSTQRFLVFLLLVVVSILAILSTIDAGRIDELEDQVEELTVVSQTRMELKMSADNYLQLDKHEDKYMVMMKWASGPADQTGHLLYSSTDPQEVFKYACDYESHEIVEYGMTFTEAFNEGFSLAVSSGNVERVKHIIKPYLKFGINADLVAREIVQALGARDGS